MNRINEIDLNNVEFPDVPDLFLENEDLEEEPLIRFQKRYIRDMQNPFEYYNNMEFKRRYRFSKNSILQGILPRIEEPLTKINNRGLPIAPVLQLLTCLRFYATEIFKLVFIIYISIYILYIYNIEYVSYEIYIYILRF